MARFYGEIGYSTGTVETAPGVWEEGLTKHTYYGDVIKNNSRMQSGENLNDNLSVNNTFSIVADQFAFENFQSMRYVKWMGVLWKITNVEVQSPRLILTIGGVFNGN